MSSSPSPSANLRVPIPELRAWIGAIDLVELFSRGIYAMAFLGITGSGHRAAQLVPLQKLRDNKDERSIGFMTQS